MLDIPDMHGSERVKISQHLISASKADSKVQESTKCSWVQLRQPVGMDNCGYGSYSVSRIVWHALSLIQVDIAV